MRLTRVIPGIASVPELYSYYCDSCGEAVTEIGEPAERRDLLCHFEMDRAASDLRRLVSYHYQFVIRPVCHRGLPCCALIEHIVAPVLDQ